MMGEKDNTAIGKDLVSPEIKAQMGLYPELARRTAKSIPGAKLILFPDLGHAPQMQNPQRFHTALVNSLLALSD
jgi:pimeloyl-ACP methyl ester carboxylesterase